MKYEYWVTCPHCGRTVRWSDTGRPYKCSRCNKDMNKIREKICTGRYMEKKITPNIIRRFGDAE